jgi:predicted RND superfamily exporter protein
MTLLLKTLRRRSVVLTGCILAVLALVPGALRLETDNSPEVFFVQYSEELDSYRAFEASFGSDELVRVVLSGAPIWSPRGLGWLAELEESIRALPEVEEVTGLYSHHRRSWESWPPAPEELRDRSLENQLDRNLGLVDDGANAITILVTLGPHPPGRERDILQRLRALASDRPAGVEVQLVGLPVLNQALDGSSREIQRLFFPLLIVFSMSLLALTFRSREGVVLPLLFVAICELLLLGAMGWAGVRLNLVLAVLPPLLFVIALATAVHLLVGYRAARQRQGPHESVISTYRDKGWAVLWTGLTTLVGFASLASSQVGPVRSLGIWSALGIAGMTAAAFVVYPALLATPLHRSAPVPDRRYDALLGSWGRRWADWAARRRVAIRLAALALATVAVLGIPRLTLESNALHYLPPTHPVRLNIEDLESRGIGMAAVELVVESTSSLRDPDALGQLSILAIDLRAEPSVLGVLGPGDLLDDAVRQASEGQLLAGRQVRQRALAELQADPQGQGTLESFLTSDGRRARLSVFTTITDYGGLELLLDTMGQLARESFPEAKILLTGQYPLLLSAQRYLFTTLAVSLSLTLVAVATILYFLLRSIHFTLLALVPNLWPVVGVLGIMGWFGIPLDIATVMVASVVLGLAVDDTIHSLGHFRELAPHSGAFEAVALTLERTAPAYLVTGFILAAGFGVCSLSDFAPTARFGGLTALAIALAVLGDLFLLPAVLASAPTRALARWADSKKPR